MSSDLHAAFSELKAKDNAIDGTANRISAIDVGDVIQIDLVGMNSAGVKKAIEVATRSNRMAFDHVIDKANCRALVKRMPDIDADSIEKMEECVKRKIIQIVSVSGTIFESSVKQRTCRSKEWSSFVNSGGDPLSFAKILNDVIATAGISRAGALISRSK